MQPIAEFGPPFNEPMPYYVSRRFADLRMQAYIQPSKYGVICQVLVP